MPYVLLICNWTSTLRGQDGIQSRKIILHQSVLQKGGLIFEFCLSVAWLRCTGTCIQYEVQGCAFSQVCSLSSISSPKVVRNKCHINQQAQYVTDVRNSTRFKYLVWRSCLFWHTLWKQLSLCWEPCTERVSPVPSRMVVHQRRCEEERNTHSLTLYDWKNVAIFFGNTWNLWVEFLCLPTLQCTFHPASSSWRACFGTHLKVILGKNK